MPGEGAYTEEPTAIESNSQVRSNLQAGKGGLPRLCLRP